MSSILRRQSFTRLKEMNMPAVSLRMAVAAGILAVAAGCANLCNLSDPSTGVMIPDSFTGTVADTSAPKSLPAPALLTNVESAECTGFDRVVFTFEGSSVPGYFVSYIDRPVRACGSGNVVPVAGDAFLEIRMSPAQAHTDAGEVTVEDRNRMLNHANLRQLVDTCDFEADVTWVLGVGSPNAYRVTELTSPPRLVLDVKH
jgi:hypothetical protein